MSLLVDTTAVPAAERFDYWASAHARVLHPLALRRPGRDPFTGRIRAHRVGPVTLYRIEGDASAIQRTARLVARHDPEELQLTHLVRGRFRIEQGGRTALVGPGDVSAYETSHPYEVWSGGRFELLLFAVPRAALGERGDDVCARTAVALDGRSGAAALAGPFLRGVADLVEDGGGAGLGECVVDLARVLFTPTPAPAPEPLFVRVTHDVERRLGDPDLGPRSLAAAHFVSPRLLHRVFAEHGHTVAGWIRSRRLEAVCRDLADPSLRDRPVRAIAAARGFVDAPHFSRLFRATHGCTPGEYRAEHAGPLAEGRGHP